MTTPDPTPAQVLERIADWRMDNPHAEIDVLDLAEVTLRAQAAALSAQRTLGEKHLSLAHTRLSQIAFTAAQEGKFETAKVYRAAVSVVADELGMFRAALAQEAHQ